MADTLIKFQRLQRTGRTARGFVSTNPRREMQGEQGNINVNATFSPANIEYARELIGAGASPQENYALLKGDILFWSEGLNPAGGLGRTANAGSVLSNAEIFLSTNGNAQAALHRFGFAGIAHAMKRTSNVASKVAVQVTGLTYIMVGQDVAAGDTLVVGGARVMTMSASNRSDNAVQRGGGAMPRGVRRAVLYAQPMGNGSQTINLVDMLRGGFGYNNPLVLSAVLDRGNLNIPNAELKAALVNFASDVALMLMSNVRRAIGTAVQTGKKNSYVLVKL